METKHRLISVSLCSLIQWTEHIYDTANWLDLLTAYDGESLTYDAIGNPLSYYNGTSYTMTWAKGRQLASVSKGSGTGATAIAYAYDMDGIRRSKTVS